MALELDRGLFCTHLSTDLNLIMNCALTMSDPQQVSSYLNCTKIKENVRIVAVRLSELQVYCMSGTRIDFRTIEMYKILYSS